MPQDRIHLQSIEVPIERLKYATKHYLSPAVANTAELAMYQDHLLGAMAYELSVHLQATREVEHQVSESTFVKVGCPASTWQMFKDLHRDAWWMRWLVRRRKVRYTLFGKMVTLNVDITGYLTYPNSTRVLPEHEFGSPVVQFTIQPELTIEDSDGPEATDRPPRHP